MSITVCLLGASTLCCVVFGNQLMAEIMLQICPIHAASNSDCLTSDDQPLGRHRLACLQHPPPHVPVSRPPGLS